MAHHIFRNFTLSICSDNGMGIDLFVDFPGEWALLALGYTQPLHLVSSLIAK